MGDFGEILIDVRHPLPVKLHLLSLSLSYRSLSPLNLSHHDQRVLHIFHRLFEIHI